MTNQVLFIQGGGEDAHDKWDDKIVESLERELGSDYAIRYPRMPHEADPTYAAWKAALKRQFDRRDDGAILIGHSIGGTILIRTLADEPPTLTFAGIFLIAAPFVGDGGWQSEDIKPLSDLGARLSEQTPIYTQAIPQAVVRRLSGRDHPVHSGASECRWEGVVQLRCYPHPSILFAIRSQWRSHASSGRQSDVLVDRVAGRRGNATKCAIGVLPITYQGDINRCPVGRPLVVIVLNANLRSCVWMHAGVQPVAQISGSIESMNCD
jgi:predicted alpha/beta hydrolase family esterase